MHAALVVRSIPFASSAGALSVLAFGLALTIAIGSSLEALVADPLGGIAIPELAVAAGLATIATPLLAIPALLKNS